MGRGGERRRGGEEVRGEMGLREDDLLLSLVTVSGEGRKWKGWEGMD